MTGVIKVSKNEKINFITQQWYIFIIVFTVFCISQTNKRVFSLNKNILMNLTNSNFIKLQIEMQMLFFAFVHTFIYWLHYFLC